MSLTEHLPAVIRSELAYQNMSLADLSDKTDISSPSLSKKLNSQTQTISLHDAERIAQALNIEVFELVRRASSEVTA